MPSFLRGDQQHFKTIHTQPGPRKMLHQHHFRPLCNQLARGQHRFVNVRHRMPAEDLQLNQVWRNNIARRQRIAYMKLRDAGRYDTALFRVPHDRIAEIFRGRIGAFHLTHDAKNMFALFRRSQVSA